MKDIYDAPGWSWALAEGLFFADGECILEALQHAAGDRGILRSSELDECWVSGQRQEHFADGRTFGTIDFAHPGTRAALLEMVRDHLKDWGAHCRPAEGGWVVHRGDGVRVTLSMPYEHEALIAAIYSIIKETP